ncbi:MAG: sigma-70 family RNA polymerase sigma factor [Planctomycetes bacterium]|nr:sigma-70 family RNA polymerase sigma factor [Planctomycetota bacterium]
MEPKDEMRDLVERARAGDREAFEKLVDLNRVRIRALVASRWNARIVVGVDIDDVYQETLLRAFEAVGRFEWRGEDSFAAWLAGIVQNVIGSLARRRALERRAQSDAEPPAETTSPSRMLRREERFDRLEASLAKLSEDHREVISLIRLKGLSFEEAGRRMDRTPDAVKQLLYRALRQLRSTFGETDSLHLPEERRLEHGERDARPGSAPR